MERFGAGHIVVKQCPGAVMTETISEVVAQSSGSAQTRGLIQALCLAAALGFSPAALAQSEPSLSMEAINSASIEGVATVPLDELAPDEPRRPEPAVIHPQVLLDRAGASPGVIDGFDGENVRKAISTIEAMWDMQVDGLADSDLLQRLASDSDIVVSYTIVEADAEDVTGAVPDDYAELAEMDFVGYASVAEAVAEKFHMDQDLLKSLNPEASFEVGAEIIVADPGEAIDGPEVVRIEADKSRREVRAYDADGALVAAYPATIGSESNPSPSGEHAVEVIVANPNYTYDPKNFMQGENTDRLIIPPGPNNPVGSTWIGLSEPGYGIHGTAEPALIDKTASHGCVRLTNWDAQELAGMVSEGTTVTFVE